MNLAIELGETGRAGYSSIHADGCRDLTDGESLGEITTREELAAAIECATGWECLPGEIGTKLFPLAPCAKL